MHEKNWFKHLVPFVLFVVYLTMLQVAQTI
jgi:hypothetical protein